MGMQKIKDQSKPSRYRRIIRWSVGVFVMIALVPAILSITIRFAEGQVHWSDARRDSSNQAPDPAAHKGAVVQVYAARTWGWRGAFGVHTWIATKPKDARTFTRFEVIGWGVRHGRQAVRIHSDLTPDAYWFGSKPTILVDLRGEDAEKVISKIGSAVSKYPYPNEYTAWPGPNSNTFTAFVAREIPELTIDLPPTAIGKDYLGDSLIAASPSGTGYQFSIKGLAGIMVAAEEGLEINLLGLTFGLDITPPAIKLPGLGRIGA